jgi:hypothetical protein
MRNQFTMAGSFFWWGFISLATSALIWWGITVLQWSWSGILVIGIGMIALLSQILATVNRSKLRRVVLSEFLKSPDLSIEDVSLSTGITRKDVQAIVLDLKASGQFIGSFSSKTGQIEHLIIKEKSRELEGENKYCPYCGTLANEDSAQYCVYCGAEI